MFYNAYVEVKNMELYAKGQLSYLILTCMQERDFYGLDIISEISNRSNGRINLKKPSVYSNLTRMEKQGYITSYLQSSDFGPNRKYYSLTEKGRGFYSELKSYFEKNNIDVFRDFQDEVQVDDSTQPMQNVEVSTETKRNEEDDGFFDFSSLNEALESPSIEPVREVQVVEEQNVVVENKTEEISLFNLTEENVINNENVNINNSPQKTEEPSALQEPEQPKDDAVFLTNENVNDYNKRLYDISKDINKIKRKRSFADDQIAMTATDPLYVSNEKVKLNIENFKNSILENREKYQENRTNSFEYFKQKNIIETNKPVNQPSTPTLQQKKEEEAKDDAKFITNRIDVSQVERAKKIEPPKLKIVSENTKDTRLPAPKRDKTIDPSHREILNKLYLRTKDGNTSEAREDSIYDYNDLKDYYKSQNITFNIYEKSMVRSKHNTNKLYFINSLIVFLLSAIISTTLFLVFNNTALTYSKTNFLFILLPALTIIDVVYKFYNYRNYNGWIPTKIKPQWQVWLIYFIASLAVVGLNFAFGLAVKPFELFATTLVLPLAIIFIMIPLRYYLKRLLLVKFWK